MPSIKYGYTDPFIFKQDVKLEVTEENVDQIENHKVGDVYHFKRDYNRAPIRLRTKEWRQTGDDRFRLMFRVFVTPFAEELLEADGIPENVVAPGWWDGEAKENYLMWIDAVKNGTLPKEVIVDSIENASVEKIELHEIEDSVRGEVEAVVDIIVNEFPVFARFGPVEIEFEPISGVR